MIKYACDKCGQEVEILKKDIHFDRPCLSGPKIIYCSVYMKCTNVKCSLYYPFWAKACHVWKRVMEEKEELGQMEMFV